MNYRPDNSRTHGYSLSFLFLLVAVCAVVVAVAGTALVPLRLRPTDYWVQPAAVTAAVIAAVLLGAVIGLHHYRRLRGLCWGVLTGLLVALVAAPLAVVPEFILPRLMGATLGGTVVLLFVAAVVRLTTPATSISLKSDGSQSTDNRALASDPTTRP